MILDDRPHRLQYVVTTPGYEDENGDYHEGESRYGSDIPCRAVQAGQASERMFEDGIVRKYSYTIYMDDDCPFFALGDKVRVRFSGSCWSRELEVLGFNRGQLHAKLWV